MKKVFSVFLALLFATSIFVSCNQETKENLSLEENPSSASNNRHPASSELSELTGNSFPILRSENLLADKEYLTTYIYPLLYGRMLELSWNNPNELEGWRFYTSYQFNRVLFGDYVKDEDIDEDYNYYEPAATYEKYVHQYFPEVTSETLHTFEETEDPEFLPYYMSETDTYRFSMYGTSFIGDARILSIEQNLATREATFYVAIVYEAIDEENLDLNDKSLSLHIQFREDGSFYYTGVTKKE